MGVSTEDELSSFPRAKILCYCVTPKPSVNPSPQPFPGYRKGTRGIKRRSERLTKLLRNRLSHHRQWLHQPGAVDGPQDRSQGFARNGHRTLVVGSSVRDAEVCAGSRTPLVATAMLYDGKRLKTEGAGDVAWSDFHVTMDHGATTTHFGFFGPNEQRISSANWLPWFTRGLHS